MKNVATISGTREWAHKTANCTNGCIHGCKYCFARYDAVVRFKRLTQEQWANPSINEKALSKKWPKSEGTTIMFPSTHDIFPSNLDACLKFLENILKSGNNVLIVTKPHFECTKKICDSFENYKSQILFRFTICASDNSILQYWEPGAPSFEERFTSLKLAHDRGFETSISMEPCLDWPNVVDNFHLMAPYVTNSIWIGTLNYIDDRVEVKTDKDREMVKQMKSWMTQETFQKVYEALKDHPLIKWKESMKKALNLPLVDEVGKDI